MSDPDTRRAPDSYEHESIVAEYKSQGYRVTSGEIDPEGVTKLKETGVGGLLLHIVLFLMSAGIFNLIYVLYKKAGHESVIVKTVDDDSEE